MNKYIKKLAYFKNYNILFKILIGKAKILLIRTKNYHWYIVQSSTIVVLIHFQTSTNIYCDLLISIKKTVKMYISFQRFLYFEIGIRSNNLESRIQLNKRPMGPHSSPEQKWAFK